MATTTIYLQSFTWNSVTYNTSTGGPIKLVYENNTENVVRARSGDDFYAKFVAGVGGFCRVMVTLQEVKLTTALNTKSNGSGVCTGKANTSTVSFAGLVLVGVVDGTQEFGTPGTVTLVFEHESADASTNPVS